MSDLLIIGTNILAVGPFTITDDSVIGPDIAYPKSVIVGWEIVTADLPPGFTVIDYEWISGQLQKIPIPIPPLTTEQANQNYIGMMESRADSLEAAGDLLDALLLRESLK